MSTFLILITIIVTKIKLKYSIILVNVRKEHAQAQQLICLINGLLAKILNSRPLAVQTACSDMEAKNAGVQIHYHCTVFKEM